VLNGAGGVAVGLWGGDAEERRLLGELSPEQGESEHSRDKR